MERFRTFEQANRAGYAVPLASIDPRYFLHGDKEYKISEEIALALPKYKVKLIAYDGLISEIGMVNITDIQRVLAHD